MKNTFFIALSILTHNLCSGQIQESLPGLYKYWFVVNGYDLQINVDATFRLSVTGNIIEPPTWTGDWTTNLDTLVLNFSKPINGNYQIKHFIENEFLIRGTLTENSVEDSIWTSPNYFYKTLGYHTNGNVKVQARWEGYGFFLFSSASRYGEWKYYYEKGGLKKVEQYKNGELHGDIEIYWQSGRLHKILKYRKGLLRKEKVINEYS